jgi:hypothetical protein
MTLVPPFRDHLPLAGVPLVPPPPSGLSYSLANSDAIRLRRAIVYAAQGVILTPNGVLHS